MTSAEWLLGFQVGGESLSRAPHGWKQFDVAQIRQLRVLERQFAGTRADSAQHHRTWDTLFARRLTTRLNSVGTVGRPH